MAASTNGNVDYISFPAPHAEVLPGVVWGTFDTFMTPAFWAGRAWLHSFDGTFKPSRLGATFQEEVAACILGGHGLPAEIGLAAFERLQARGMLCGQQPETTLRAALSEPLLVRGRPVRYRFARQKAGQLAQCFSLLAQSSELPEDDLALRAFLMHLPGIGPKTASWITRNWKGSDRVAILDVHICRACIVAGVFPPESDPARSYFALEDRFLAFADAIGVRPSILDNLMWYTMRKMRHTQPILRNLCRQQKFSFLLVADSTSQ